MKNRVLLVLVIGGALAAWGLAFLTVAPNRLVSGTAIPLAQISGPLRDVLLLPAAVLVLGVFLPQRGRTHVACCSRWGTRNVTTQLSPPCFRW